MMHNPLHTDLCSQFSDLVIPSVTALPLYDRRFWDGMKSLSELDPLAFDHDAFTLVTFPKHSFYFVTI